DAAGGLELADGGAEGEVVAENLLEGSTLQHAELERGDGAGLPRPDVAGVGERPVQLVAAGLHHVAVDGGGVGGVELQEDDVVARVRRHVGVAGVVHHLQLLAGEHRPRRRVHRQLQVLLAVLVDVDRQHQVPPAHELELGRRVVEPCHLHHVPQPIPVKP
ncbi:Os01g0221000, partial [Oryza sativa Japonica Group]